jgi:hypothetical protein
VPADQPPPETVVSTVVIGGHPSSSDPGWIGTVHRRVVTVPAETLVRVVIVSFERYRALSFFFIDTSLASLGENAPFHKCFSRIKGAR